MNFETSKKRPASLAEASPRTGVIRKAVFPVAGLGTRFLPATKAVAKEMLPVVDRPLIQYAIEEARAAGITEMIFVTSRTKRAIEDHVDRMPDLEAELEQQGKHALLEELRALTPEGVKFSFVRQSAPRGLGHAIQCARHLVGNEPFAVLLPDDLIDAQPGALAQLVAHYEKVPASLVAVQPVKREDTRRYGIVDIHATDARGARLKTVVEKPKPEDAPSTLGVVGRYVFTPAIFDCLDGLEAGAGGEIQLTDGIARLLQHEPVFAYRYQGKRYDCGGKLGYLEATLAYALKHAELGSDFRQLLLHTAQQLTDLPARRLAGHAQTVVRPLDIGPLKPAASTENELDDATLASLAEAAVVARSANGSAASSSSLS